MTLMERMEALNKRRADVQALRERALKAADDAAFELVQIEAQLALLVDLEQESLCRI